MTKPRVRLLTASRMKDFRACNYRHFLAYVRGYRPVKTKHALYFGTLVHALIEAYWRGRMRGLASFDALCEALQLIALRGVEPVDEVKARCMMVAYHAVWSQTKCRVLAVEAQFDFPLVHPEKPDLAAQTWRCAGKIDLILELEDGRIAEVEHKTSSEDASEGSDYRRRLTLDEQIGYYLFGAESLGYRPDVIIYDVLAKPKHAPHVATPEIDRKYTKAGTLYKTQRAEDEPLEEFEARLIGEMRKDFSRWVHRAEVYRFEHEKRRFRLNVWNQAKLMSYAEKEDCHPPNSDACFRYRGSPCAYLGVCEGTASLEDEATFVRSDNVHPELEAPATEQASPQEP